MELIKNIVVKASMSNEMVIYKFPSNKRYIIMQKSKNNKLEIVSDIDVKEI